MKTVTAAVLRDPRGQFSLERLQLGDLYRDEILVRIEACGICHTDAKYRSVIALPAVLGHEGAGIVEEIGRDVSGISPGDRVVLSYPWCGNCRFCRNNQPYHCESMLRLSFGGTRLDGSRPLSHDEETLSCAFFQQSSFASYAITPASAVVPVNSELPSWKLAALGCGVQTGAGAVLNSFGIAKGSSLLVFGAGTVGLSALMAAKVADAATIIVVDRVQTRLDLALELGANHVVNLQDGDIPAQVRGILPQGVEYALDTSATVEGLKDALECITQGGRVGIVSFPLGGKEFPFTTKTLFIRVGILQAIIQGHAVPRQFIPKLIELQRQGLFPFEKLITAYNFADINQAFDDAESGKTIKPVLEMRDI